MRLRVTSVIILVVVFLSRCDCGENYDFDATAEKNLTAVAGSNMQWTGIAVSDQDRIFVSFPNRSSSHAISVAEVTDSVNFKSYPDDAWNSDVPNGDPENSLVAVQSVFIDNAGFLWILDSANPERDGRFTGVVAGGAKLLQVDLATNKVVNKIKFEASVVTPATVLSDVRVDEQRRMAYVTDSNEGALLVVNLENGGARRLLEGDPSTQSDHASILIDGTEFPGQLTAIHANSLALTPDRRWLYWRSMAGQPLYRINTDFLRDESLKPSDIPAKVEKIDIPFLPLSDGMMMGSDGTLYLTSMETHAVLGVRNNTFFRVRQNKELLQWPSSCSIANGFMFVATSQPSLTDARRPYRIFKFQIPGPKG